MMTGDVGPQNRNGQRTTLNVSAVPHAVGASKGGYKCSAAVKLAAVMLMGRQQF